jgi:hypothetical protein
MHPEVAYMSFSGLLHGPIGGHLSSKGYSAQRTHIGSRRCCRGCPWTVALLETQKMHIVKKGCPSA